VDNRTCDDLIVLWFVQQSFLRFLECRRELCWNEFDDLQLNETSGEVNGLTGRFFGEALPTSTFCMLICPDAESARDSIAGFVRFGEPRTQHRLRLDPPFELFVQTLRVGRLKSMGAQ